MRAKRKLENGNWVDDAELEGALPLYSAEGVDVGVLQSAIALLKTILSGQEPSKELLSNDFVGFLNSKKSDKSEHISQENIFSNKPQLTKRLFETICEQAKPFLLISKSQNKIVYGDPSDPHNVDKQIEYHWNAATNLWKIVSGAQAKALIPDMKNNSLVAVNSGKVVSYGEVKSFEISKASVVSVGEDKDLVLIGRNKEILDEKIGHRIYAFSVPEDKIGDLKHYATQFTKETCSAGRSTLIGDIIKTFVDTEHNNIIETLSYTDKNNNFYMWKDIGADGKMGLKYKPDGSVDIILQDAPLTTGHLVLVGHKDVGKSGFAGAQGIYLKKDGSTGFFKNSDYEKPEVSENIYRISPQEMQKHLENARQAAKAYLLGEEFIAEVVSSDVKKDSVPEQKPVQAVVGEATARLQEQRTAKAAIKLPDNIKVTGLDGANIFEMHCAFRQEPFKIDTVEEDAKTKEKKIVQREQGCLDENGKRYAANVYVLKKIGSDFDKKKQDSLIVEISDAGEIRLRSGETGGKFVEAKVTSTCNGKDYTAILGAEDDMPKHTFDENAEGTPFRSSNDSSFMCVRNCLRDKYDEQNKRIIENPTLAAQIAR